MNFVAIKTNLLILPAIENTDEIVKGISNPIDFTKGSFSRVEFRFKDNRVQLLHEDVDLKDVSWVWLSSFWGSRDLAYAVKLYLDHLNKLGSFFVCPKNIDLDMYFNFEKTL